MNDLPASNREGQAPVTPIGGPNGSPPHPVPNSAEVLPYRSGTDDRPSRVWFLMTLCFGFMLSASAVAVCGLLWVFYASVKGLPSPLLASVVAVVLLAGIGIWAHRVGSGGLLLGMCIGFGVSILMEGLCFAMAMK